MSAFPLEQEIEYPTSDGHLMAETQEHQQVMIDLILGLRQRYAERSDVWVAGNFILCYERGNPRAHVAPDVMLAIGVEKRKRLNYLLWEEKPPSLVMEVTSKSTRQEDEGKKKTLYERIGVEEYVLFDPFGEYLRPRLQGYRLTESIPADPPRKGRIAAQPHACGWWTPPAASYCCGMTSSESGLVLSKRPATARLLPRSPPKTGSAL